jgi:putative transposase
VAFAQLGQYLQYKANKAGVAFVQVDPAYTSQTCHVCGHVDKKPALPSVVHLWPV